jgi:hypothetical protein
MNIFSCLTVGHPWKVKGSRYLTWDEVYSVLYAEVVLGKFCKSVCFHLNTGVSSRIPLTTNSDACVGDIVDPTNVKVITLYKDDEEIIRIEV